MTIEYEILEQPAEDGVLLELYVGGARVARAKASADIIKALHAQFGLQREAVVSDLRKSLLDALKTQRQFIQISNLVEDRERPLRFWARFVFKLREELSTGVVWYDVNTSATGPEEAPAVVRNELRFLVHRRLTTPGSAARALVDLHADSTAK